VGALGVRPIEYRPWRGERTNPERRFLVISWNLFRRSLRAKGVIVVLVLGILLAHTFPIIGAILVSHEEVTNKDIIGTETEQTIEDMREVTGGLNISSSIKIDGHLTFNGTLSIVGSDFSVDGPPPSAYLRLHGSISGMGMLSVDEKGDVVKEGLISTEGTWNLTGILFVQGELNGSCTIQGYGNMTGNGTVEGTYETVTYRGGGYLTSGVFVLFTILLAAILCSDVISNDLADSSFVLYFSRPVKTLDYLLGKFVGLLMVMSIYCLVLPILYVLVMLGTQSGSDYGGGLAILGKTFLAGLLTSAFFLPLGLLLSSLTKRKAYAGIGIFATMFVLIIVGGIFYQFDTQWALIDPTSMLFFTYYGTFGAALPVGIAAWELASVMLAVTMVPLVVVYWLLERKGAGK